MLLWELLVVGVNYQGFCCHLDHLLIIYGYLVQAEAYHDCLLCPPSFSIPSQPVTLPAISSTLPNPLCCGSRLALACFMASMPAVLSFSADEVQAVAPVTLPMTDLMGD